MLQYDPKRAFKTGVLSGIVTALLLAFARALNLRVPLELLLGTSFGIPPSPAAWGMGLAVHLLLSGLFAQLYAVAFVYLFHHANWTLGVRLSLAHFALIGIALGFLPNVNKFVPEVIASPGLFLSNLGVDGVLFLAFLHLSYGALLGILYSQPIEAPFRPYNIDEIERTESRRQPF